MSRDVMASIAVAIEGMDGKFQAALPKHIGVEKFKRTLLLAIQQKPELMELDRESLYRSCQLAAIDGLMPDGREAALVPMKGFATYMPMVLGILKRLRQSGDVVKISARIVHEKDRFEYFLGDNEEIVHAPFFLGEDPGKIIAAYAIAELKNGHIQREVMSRADIDRVRATSRAGNSGPWRDHYSEMARKTVVRRIAKYLPQSNEIGSLFDLSPDHFETVTVAPPVEGEISAGTAPRALAAMRASEPRRDAPKRPEPVNCVATETIDADDDDDDDDDDDGDGDEPEKWES